MVRAALVTPAYLSVAWVLMVSYQVFTQTAVNTVVYAISPFLPVVGSWLTMRMDIVVFVYAFAWVFVLSSIIPSLILGKERSVLIQFIVCLTLTLTGIILIDTLKNIYSFDLSNREVLFSNPFTQLFNNVFFAVFYLSLPYVFMLAIDINARKKRKQDFKRIKDLTDGYFSKRQ
ncbi:MAG: hypothetical protein NWE98_04000 [Candidatus Bathyarchaeota archaeon]|nr:hypothetical protein [Candidatus Bathyarchaeota archaeon]